MKLEDETKEDNNEGTCLNSVFQTFWKHGCA